MYANDTTRFSAGNNESLGDHVTANLTKAYQWITDNKLTLNISKTKNMMFGSRLTISKVINPVICIDNQNQEIFKSFKYLGIVFDDKLNFSDHMAYLK